MAFRDFRETGPTVVARISLSSKKFISGAFAQAQVFFFFAVRVVIDNLSITARIAKTKLK